MGGRRPDRQRRRYVCPHNCGVVFCCVAFGKFTHNLFCSKALSIRTDSRSPPLLFVESVLNLRSSTHDGSFVLYPAAKWNRNDHTSERYKNTTACECVRIGRLALILSPRSELTASYLFDSLAQTSELFNTTPWVGVSDFRSRQSLPSLCH